MLHHYNMPNEKYGFFTNDFVKALAEYVFYLRMVISHIGQSQH